MEDGNCLGCSSVVHEIRLLAILCQLLGSSYPETALRSPNALSQELVSQPHGCKGALTGMFFTDWQEWQELAHQSTVCPCLCLATKHGSVLAPSCAQCLGGFHATP